MQLSGLFCSSGSEPSSAEVIALRELEKRDKRMDELLEELESIEDAARGILDMIAEMRDSGV